LPTAGWSVRYASIRGAGAMGAGGEAALRIAVNASVVWRKVSMAVGGARASRAVKASSPKTRGKGYA